MNILRYTSTAIVLASLLTSSAYAAKFMVSFKESAPAEQFKTTIQNQKSLNIKLQDDLSAVKMLIVQADTKDQILDLVDKNDINFIEIQKSFAGPKVEIIPTPSSGIVRMSVMNSQLAVSQGLKLIQVPAAWPISRGAGARVLIIDSGIDQNHPAFKGRIEKVKNFTDEGGELDVIDTDGHGTHVAGIVAAQATDEAVGVAPEARLLVAKVCGLKGCKSDAIARALYWALQEEVDVVNISLGGGGSVTERYMINQLDGKQMPVVAAIGNNGVEMTPMPAGYSAVTAVGAVEMNGQRAAFSNWSKALDVMAPGVGIRSAVPLGMGRAALAGFEAADGTFKNLPAVTFMGIPTLSLYESAVFAEFGTTDDLAKVAVKGKVLVVNRGNLPLIEKIKNAHTAGAAALIICNNDSALISGTLSKDPNDLQLPVMMVEKVAGEALVTELKNSPALKVQFDIQTADYAEFSGTSMASPYVTGVVTLMKSVVPGITSFKVRDILDKTSTPMKTEIPNQTGKGLVNAKAAVDAAYAVRKKYRKF